MLNRLKTSTRNVRSARRAGRLGAASVALSAVVLGSSLTGASADIFDGPAGPREVVGAILANYESLGGPSGVLGYPTTDELPTPDGVGRRNNFERGSIYWTPQTGAAQVGGAIRTTWAALGWEGGVLGYPVTNERSASCGDGRYNNFQRGSVYWSPSTGANEVRGAIRTEWGAAGWECGPLGFPVTGELPTRNSGGSYSHFQGGSVYWSPAAGAHGVRAGIRSVWAASGWENGPLGFPKSGEYGIAGGVAQDFQFGRIVWTPSSGTAVEPRAPFANCTDARNAGAAPIYRGQYGYADNLDRDQDGVACEV